MSEQQEQMDYEALNAHIALELNNAQQRIKKLETQLEKMQTALTRTLQVEQERDTQIIELKAQLEAIADGSSCCGNLWKARAQKAEAKLKELKPYIDHKYPCSRRIDPRSDYSCGCGLHAIRNKALEK